jgi:transposase/transcription elongation factor Elf1
MKMTKKRRKKRVHMKQLREIFRLKFNCKRSSREIASMLKISPGTVSNYLIALDRMGLSWEKELQKLSEEELHQKFINYNIVDSNASDNSNCNKEFTPLDFNYIYQELKRKGVTLLLLWEEYKEQNPGTFYSRSRFCSLYKKWSKTLNATMRHSHKAGDKLFIDYCGPTIPIIDYATGEEKEAQVFVAVMGASNYTYAEATWTQSLIDWTASHTRMFDFLGGVPNLLVPDNLKSGVKKACKYDPVINSTYSDLICHYDTAVMPARPYRPRDKAKAEAGVLLVERWIMAKLRNIDFFSLAEVNNKIKELLEVLNNKKFQKLDGSRKSQFELLDKPTLKQLPKTKYEFTEEKKVKLNIDYHFEIKSHYYSAPYTLIGKSFIVKYNAYKVEAIYQGKKIAIHARNYKRGSHTTLPEHMPEKHKKHLAWSSERFINWASKIGPETSSVVKFLIKKKKHPEQSYRTCLGLLNLSKTYGEKRLESASKIANKVNAKNRASILQILKNGMDKIPQSKEEEHYPVQEHKNIRGPEYFINNDEVTK